MTALLIVRAEVPDEIQDEFDQWYEMNHLPDGKAAFRAETAFRGWCDEKPGVHIAVYQFPDLNRARAAVASEEIKKLISEFDHVWRGRVYRSREIYEVLQSL